MQTQPVKGCEVFAGAIRMYTQDDETLSKGLMPVHPKEVPGVHLC